MANTKKTSKTNTSAPVVTYNQYNTKPCKSMLVDGTTVALICDGKHATTVYIPKRFGTDLGEIRKHFSKSVAEFVKINKGYTKNAAKEPYFIKAQFPTTVKFDLVVSALTKLAVAYNKATASSKTSAPKTNKPTKTESKSTAKTSSKSSKTPTKKTVAPSKSSADIRAEMLAAQSKAAADAKAKAEAKAKAPVNESKPATQPA